MRFKIGDRVRFRREVRWFSPVAGKTGVIFDFRGKRPFVKFDKPDPVPGHKNQFYFASTCDEHEIEHYNRPRL